jgi:hypothetical protein
MRDGRRDLSVRAGRICLAALGAVVLVAPPGQPARADDGWVSGQTARLKIDLKEMPRHDASNGAVVMRLESAADHRAILTKTMEGTWRVLAYVPSARMFVLGGQFEVGAWLPLDVVSYLDEKTGALRPARHNEDWMALAAVPSPDGRFIAFVGARADEYFRLELLDTVNDALYELGQPPAPPPDPQRTTKGEGHDWDWGDPIDGMTDMDAGIITFPDDHTLRVSFGRDTFRARAKRRTVRSWDLRQVVAKRRPVKVPATPPGPTDPAPP